MAIALYAGCAGPPASTPSDPSDSDTGGPIEAVDSDTDPLVTDTMATQPDTDNPPCPPGIAAFISAIPYATVQDALDQAAPGDTVDVCPGTWPGDLVGQIEGDLTIRSVTGEPDSVHFEAPKVNENTLILFFSSISNLLIKDITFHGAIVAWGPEPWIAASGHARIENLRFIDSGAALIMNFETATANDLHSSGGPKGDNSTLSFRNIKYNISIDRTSITNTYGNYPPIKINRTPNMASTLTIEIHNVNVSQNETGSITPIEMSLEGYESIVNISNLTVQNNDSSPVWLDNGGGGIEIRTRRTRPADVSVHISNSTFDGNLGILSSHLWVSTARDDFSGTTTVDITDTVFYRGGVSPTYTDPPQGQEGWAIRRDGDIQVNLSNVDFGTGPTANIRDLSNCPDVDGIVASAVWESDATCP